MFVNLGGIINLLVVTIPTLPASPKSATDDGFVVPIPTPPIITLFCNASIPLKNVAVVFIPISPSPLIKTPVSYTHLTLPTSDLV